MPFSVLFPFPRIPLLFFFSGRLQLSGVGPPDPLPSRVRFVSLALVAPFPPQSACVVFSRQDLWWVPLPGLRAPRDRCLSPTWSPVFVGTVLRCYDFFLRHPRSLACPLCSVPFPRCPLALCCSPPCGAVGFCSFFFAVLSDARFPPPCMQAQQHCTAFCLGSDRCSHPVPSPSCGAALGGPRPCQVGTPPLRPCPLCLL